MEENKSVQFKRPPPTIEESLSRISWSMKDLIAEIKILNENLDKHLGYMEQITFRLDR